MRFSSRWTADLGAVVLGFAVPVIDSGCVIGNIRGLMMNCFGHGIFRSGVAELGDHASAAAIACFGLAAGSG